MALALGWNLLTLTEQASGIVMTFTIGCDLISLIFTLLNPSESEVRNRIKSLITQHNKNDDKRKVLIKMT